MLLKTQRGGNARTEVKDATGYVLRGIERKLVWPEENLRRNEQSYTRCQKIEETLLRILTIVETKTTWETKSWKRTSANL